MEGLLTLFQATFPHDADDPRRMGFGLGQQVVGLYIVEMLLKYALDDGVPHGHLQDLFRNLSRQRKRAVERKYKDLLNSEFDWAWDVAETVDSILEYMGNNAITDTRYFWEEGRSHAADHASILISPRMPDRWSSTLHREPAREAVRHDLEVQGPRGRRRPAPPWPSWSPLPA